MEGSEMKRLSWLAAALVTFAFVGVMAAQMYNETHDKVVVTFPYPVHVEGEVLPPGQYRIVEENEPTGTPSLIVEGQQGYMLKTVALTPARKIPTNSKAASSETQVMLWKLGNDYYLNKVWMKGRTVGWEVQLPGDVNSQQGKSVEVSGTYWPAQHQAKQSGNSAAGGMY